MDKPSSVSGGRSSASEGHRTPTRTSSREGAPQAVPGGSGSRGRPTGEKTAEASRVKVKVARGAGNRAPKSAAPTTRADAKRTARTSRASATKTEIDRRKRAVASARRQPNPAALTLAANLGLRREKDCAIRKSFSIIEYNGRRGPARHTRVDL